MKGLMKYLSPFASDISGAVAVLYEMGGLIVILDAGGCTGNVCGFDEPRFVHGKSAVFSAGLRDLDAILGRDTTMLEKTEKALKQIDAKFVAFIGTPVPAVIGTDFQALTRLGERRFNLPVLSIDTTGMDNFDKGAEKAYSAVLSKFGSDANTKKEDKVGILGALPQDLLPGDTPELIAKRIAICENADYVLFNNLIDFQAIGDIKKNVVIAPSGLKAAEEMNKRFDIPFEICYPVNQLFQIDIHEGDRVLIVHQAFAAESLKQEILQNHSNISVDTATFFISGVNDKSIQLKEEDDFLLLIQKNNYTVIAADDLLRDAVNAADQKTRFVPLDHFVISGNDGELYDV